MSVRVLITRERAEPLAGMLADAGCDPVHVPLVELVATGSMPPDGVPDAVLVTSASVVRFVPDLVKHIGSARVVAVGQATAGALREAGVTVSDVGDAGGVAALSQLDARSGQAVWYVGAGTPSPGLDRALHAGIQRWSVYESRTPADAAGVLNQVLPVDVVTFTSGAAVRAFVDSAGAADASVVVLGPSTAEAAQAAGLAVAAVADRRDLAALAEAVLALP